MQPYALCSGVKSALSHSVVVTTRKTRAISIYHVTSHFPPQTPDEVTRSGGPAGQRVIINLQRCGRLASAAADISRMPRLKGEQVGLHPNKSHPHIITKLRPVQVLNIHSLMSQAALTHADTRNIHGQACWKKSRREDQKKHYCPSKHDGTASPMQGRCHN